MFYNESVLYFFFPQVRKDAHILKNEHRAGIKKLKRKEINLNTFKVNSGYFKRIYEYLKS